MLIWHLAEVAIATLVTFLYSDITFAGIYASLVLYKLTRQTEISVPFIISDCPAQLYSRSRYGFDVCILPLAPLFAPPERRKDLALLEDYDYCASGDTIDVGLEAQFMCPNVIMILDREWHALVTAYVYTLTVA